VTDLLAKVTVPTLVMDARDEARVPFDAGRRLAAGIPGARFVPLQSRNHLILEEEPAYARFVEEIRSFLGGQ
jgi:pimeloyl-ACP methyl ester carboxylesterase